MDFQEIISLVFFIAYIVYRYFLKGKSKDDTATKPERRPKPSREESRPQNTAPDKKKPSPFEEIFKELEKEFGGAEEEKKEMPVEPKVHQSAKAEKAERDLLKKQSEMQKIAEAEYNRALNEPEEKFPNSIGRSKKTSKKKASFNARKAYMYKELLDRKHFEV